MKLMLLLSAVILVCQADEAPKDDDPDIVIFNDGMFRMLPEVGGHHIVLVPVAPLPTVSEYKKEDADKIIITARSMMKPKNMEMTTELDPATETQRKKRSIPFTSETVEWFTNLPDDLDVTTTEPCDLLCTKLELDPICASNGVCLHEFPNQCTLDTYNCKHKGGALFKPTEHKDKCQMYWLDKCDESEMQ